MSTKYFWIDDFGYPVLLDDDIKKLKLSEAKDKSLYHSVTTKRLPKDIQISNQHPQQIRDRIFERGPKAKITTYSLSSQKRFEVVARNVCEKLGVMITLTYPGNYPMDGAVVKEHLHFFLIYVKRKGYEYLWTLEFQMRGAPHFHILVDKEIPYEWVASTWYGIVGSEDPRHLQAGTRVEAIRNRQAMGKYITTYLKKWQQKVVPSEYLKVGRFWGRSRKLMEIEKCIYYGYEKPIQMFRKQQRIIRKWSDGKMRHWGKRKTNSPYVQKNACLNVKNVDKLIEFLAEKGVRNPIFGTDTFGLSL